MKDLSDILPCSKRIICLKESFKDSLFISLKHLLEVSQEVIDTKLFQEVNSKFDALSSQSDVSGLLYAYNYEIIKSIKSNNIFHVKSLFESISKKNFIIDEKFILYNDLNLIEKNILKEICSFEIRKLVTFSEINISDFENTKNFINQGLCVLSTSLPDWYEEIHLLVNEFLILNVKNLRAGSSFDLFGLIYINSNYKTKYLTDIISFIVHESAHLYIFLLSLKDSLVLNSPNERYQPSSEKNILRLDKRPLIGIFHATFVLTRMIYVLEILLLNKKIPELEISHCKNLIEKYKNRFLWSCETLHNHGKMTDLGHRIIKSCKNSFLTNS